jgi:hypothetical protein
MIAPLLPGAEKLPRELAGAVDFVLVDRLNYHYANRIYRENNMEWAIEDRFFAEKGDELKRGFEREGVPVNILFLRRRVKRSGDLRKFTEQSGVIIQWDQSYRAYIMTHDVSGIDWKNYKHPLPEHVYDVYAQYWKDVRYVL